MWVDSTAVRYPALPRATPRSRAIGTRSRNETMESAPGRIVKQPSLDDAVLGPEQSVAGILGGKQTEALKWYPGSDINDSYGLDKRHRANVERKRATAQALAGGKRPGTSPGASPAGKPGGGGKSPGGRSSGSGSPRSGRAGSPSNSKKKSSSPRGSSPPQNDRTSVVSRASSPPQNAAPERIPITGGVLKVRGTEGAAQQSAQGSEMQSSNARSSAVLAKAARAPMVHVQSVAQRWAPEVELSDFEEDSTNSVVNGIPNSGSQQDSRMSGYSVSWGHEQSSHDHGSSKMTSTDRGGFQSQSLWASSGGFDSSRYSQNTSVRSLFSPAPSMPQVPRPSGKSSRRNPELLAELGKWHKVVSGAASGKVTDGGSAEVGDVLGEGKAGKEKSSLSTSLENQHGSGPPVLGSPDGARRDALMAQLAQQQAAETCAEALKVAAEARNKEEYRRARALSKTLKERDLHLAAYRAQKEREKDMKRDKSPVRVRDGEGLSETGFGNFAQLESSGGTGGSAGAGPSGGSASPAGAAAVAAPGSAELPARQSSIEDAVPEVVHARKLLQKTAERYEKQVGSLIEEVLCEKSMASASSFFGEKLSAAVDACEAVAIQAQAKKASVDKAQGAQRDMELAQLRQARREADAKKRPVFERWADRVSPRLERKQNVVMGSTDRELFNEAWYAAVFGFPLSLEFFFRAESTVESLCLCHRCFIRSFSAIFSAATISGGRGC